MSFKLPVFVIAALSLFGVQAHASSDSEVCRFWLEYCQRDVAEAWDRFKVGEYTRKDVMEAEVMLLSQQYACGLLTKPVYCQEKGSRLAQILVAAQQEYQAGFGTIWAVESAARRKAEFQAFCASDETTEL